MKVKIIKSGDENFEEEKIKMFNTPEAKRELLKEKQFAPPMNLIGWFIDLSLEDKIRLFNYINNRNLKRQEDYKKNQQKEVII